MAGRKRSTVLTVIIAAILSLAGPAAAGADASPDKAFTKRYEQLVKIVDKNTGFAHFTRGMNAGTIHALRSTVSESDIPVLRAMLADKDTIVVMTSVRVLMDLGKEGRSAVYGTLMQATSQNVKRVITITDQVQSFLYLEKSPVVHWTEDIPLLKRLAESTDVTTVVTATMLLEKMGEEGMKALQELLATSGNQMTRSAIEDWLKRER